MVDTGRHLYRSDDAIIGGVCAGIAEYFQMDPTIVRVIAVIILLLGIGSPVLVYLVMMLVIPKKPSDYSAYVDVNPVQSSSPRTPYTAADFPNARSAGAPVPPEGATYCPPTNPFASATDAFGASAAAGAATAAGATAASGSAFDASGTPFPNDFATPPAGNATPGAAYSATPPAGNATPGAAYSATYGTVRDASSGASGQRPWYVWPGVIIGLTFIGIGAGTLLGRFIPGVSWLSFWPFIIIACGVVSMFVPPRGEKWSVRRILSGLSTVAVGLIFLGCSMHAFGWGVWLAIFSLWPLFIIWVGLECLSHALRSKVFQCISSLFFIATLGLGVFNYYYSTDYLTAPIGVEKDSSGNYTPYYYNSTYHRPSVAEQGDTSEVDMVDLSAFDEATFTYEGGAAEILMCGRAQESLCVAGTDDLVNATSISLDASHEVANVFASSGFANNRFVVGTVSIGLANAPLWNTINLSTGACDLNIDFCDLRIRNLVLETGASDVQVILGAPQSGGSTFEINAGATSVDVYTPADCAISLVVDGALNDIDVEGLSWDDATKRWLSDSYASAKAADEPVWDITIAAALGRFSVYAR